jgi:hypothetical protein
MSDDGACGGAPPGALQDVEKEGVKGQTGRGKGGGAAGAMNRRGSHQVRRIDMGGGLEDNSGGGNNVGRGKKGLGYRGKGRAAFKRGGRPTSVA